MAQEVIEITEREVEIIEVIERGPVGPQGPQPDINYEVVSSARTLEAADLIAADTSGGSFTLTLPPNPSNGDAVDIFDFSETFDTNPLTIARNGQPIESLNEDLVANVEGAYFTLIYTGATRGWQVLPRYGTSGGGGESALTTQGDMLYRGVGINTRLPIGSAGQILKVNSGATAPEWGAAPATGVTSVGVSGSDGIEVDSGSPITGSGTIALGVNAASLRSHINVADGANNYTHPNHTGEVTSSGDGATTIANDVVTNAKLANVATATIKGRATAGTGDPEDLTASQVRTILNVADGAEVNVQSNWTEADSGSDAFILNKPTLGGAAALNVGTTTGTVCAGDDARLSDSRTPSSHASSHAAAGSDPLAPSDIGAQSIFETDTSTLQNISNNVTLTARRAVIYTLSISASAAGNYTIDPPITNSLVGDVIIVKRPLIGPTNAVTFLNGLTGSSVASILQGEQYSFIFNGSLWNLSPVDTHTHAASQVTSGTLTHERGGLEADVSAYNGLIKIASGSTSAVTVTSAGEALLDDADAAAQRTTLGLGNSATLDTGTTAGTVAEGDHTHTQLHDRSHAITSTSDHTAGNHKVFYSDGSGQIQELALGNNGEVLTSNGASAAPSFAAASSGIGGGTGSVDNALLRADGTGGSTAQSSDIVIDDATTSTQANVAIVNNHSETNSSLVLTPKGTGAFIVGPKPDGTTTGGNVRGANAVDLQTSRVAATQVASGSGSVIGGGQRNRSSSSESFVGGGILNQSTSSQTVVCGGNSNLASAQVATVCGGGSSKATGVGSVVCGGGLTGGGVGARGNTASADASAILGGRDGLADRFGMQAHSTGRFSASISGGIGDAQRARFVLLCKTTTDSAVEMALDGSTTYLTIPSGKVIFCNIKVVGVKSDGSAVATYERQYAAKNVAATSSQVFAPVTIGSDNPSGTVLDVTTQDVGDYISIKVTGIASETWRWTASVDAVEVAYGT